MENIEPYKFDIPVKFGFDVTDTDIKSLKVAEGFILWSLIKQRHITDQYFDDLVFDTVKMLKQCRPKNFTEFIGVLQITRLSSQFGIQSYFNGKTRVIDFAYWLGIWHYIKNQDEFTFEYADKVYKVSEVTMANVNPQLFF